MVLQLWVVNKAVWNLDLRTISYFATKTMHIRQALMVIDDEINNFSGYTTYK